MFVIRTFRCAYAFIMRVCKIIYAYVCLILAVVLQGRCISVGCRWCTFRCVLMGWLWCVFCVCVQVFDARVVMYVCSVGVVCKCSCILSVSFDVSMRCIQYTCLVYDGSVCVVRVMPGLCVWFDVVVDVCVYFYLTSSVRIGLCMFKLCVRSCCIYSCVLLCMPCTLRAINYS